MRKFYLALFLSMLWVMALAETIDGIEYTLNSLTSTATVTNTPSGNVVIPATVKNNNRTYNVTAITGVNSEITSCEIPEGVTSIGTAFQYKYYLTSVSIPSTVQRIENEAFKNCSSLISVNILEGLTYIGSNAFFCCSGLQSITIPTTLTSMGANSFNFCKKLKKIRWNAKNCTDFSSENVAPFIYYDNGYSHGNNYTTSIIFGEEVEYIPAYLCSNFKSLLTVELPNSVHEIGECAFYNTIGSSLNSGESILKTVKFGTGLEKIGADAFYGNIFLSSITIPDNCTTIGTDAFGKCNNLSSITFGKGITIIGNYAFSENNKINTINTYTTTPPVITKDVFSGISDLMAVTLNVRTKAVDAYKAADVWKEMYVQAMENDVRTFTLNVSSADENKGTTTHGGTYDENSDVLIYAAAKEGYQFSRWNDGNTDNPRTVKMIGDLSYKAYFEAVIPICAYNITASANAEEGTVIGGGIYDAGTQITLAAIGNTGYHFAQWADGNTDNPRQVTVMADASYTAQFAKCAGKKGDTNGDGKVDVEDVVETVNIILGE